MDRKGMTVYVVDDDGAMRESLGSLMNSVGLTASVFENATEFLERYRTGAPACLVLDARLPDVSGLELLERIRAQRIHLPVILITGNADVAMAVRAMKAGAIDFLEKPFSPQLLLERVEHALRQDVIARSAEEEQATYGTRLALLTPRELEVVRLVTAGRANKEIARVLEISQKTVELHRAKAMRKLGARHVADLVRASLFGARAD